MTQSGREGGMEAFDGASNPGALVKGGPEDLPSTVIGVAAGAAPPPPESEFGGLVSYFSSQHEDFEES